MLRRKIKLIALLVGGVFALAVLVATLNNPAQAANRRGVPGRGVAPASHGLPLNHFRCYPTSGPRVVVDTATQDQFNENRFELFIELKAERFCNPVAKEHQGQLTQISDPLAHLTIYRVKKHPTIRIATTRRAVMVRNQFGTQLLRSSRVVELAVPTAKNSGNIPTNLDHFKCYRAEQLGLVIRPIVINLFDQFHPGGEGAVRVRELVRFCNPVLKRHAGNETPIQHPGDHLVCYKVAGPSFRTEISIANQFESGNLEVGSANLLCVPSEKLGWTWW
jgi:hypothetical protein